MDLARIETFVRGQLANEMTGHDLQHIERVLANARFIMAVETEPVDQEIVLAACWLHDVVDDKVADNPAMARRQVIEVLTQAGATLPERDEIMDIIDHQSFSKNLQEHQPLTHAGQIVQDADRLDALGAIGIGRAFYYGGARGHDFYNHLPVRDLSQLTLEDYRQNQSVIGHFEEKLLNLVDLMNTPTGQRLAQQRTDFMKQFLNQFWTEVGGLD